MNGIDCITESSINKTLRRLKRNKAVYVRYKMKGKQKMEQTRLKDVIREEMDKVTKMLISSDYSDKITLTKWLQSLQRINDVCKDRNRY